jgi:hypothetical protein
VHKFIFLNPLFFFHKTNFLPFLACISFHHFDTIILFNAVPSPENPAIFASRTKFSIYTSLSSTQSCSMPFHLRKTPPYSHPNGLCELTLFISSTQSCSMFCDLRKTPPEFAQHTLCDVLPY